MSREKFATQVDTTILAAVRALAHDEGRQIRALVDGALADLVEKHRNLSPRPMSWPPISAHEKFASLYKRLATLRRKLG